jgi:hypothetical protein
MINLLPTVKPSHTLVRKIMYPSIIWYYMIIKPLFTKTENKCCHITACKILIVRCW